MLQGQILLGIGFLLSGLVFFLLVWLFLRIVPRVHPPLQAPAEFEHAEIQSHQDAILLIESGGRVRDINTNARELFELIPGENPNLERLGRRVRPAEGFFEICAAEGQSRFSVNGKLVSAVSYRVPGPLPTILLTMRNSNGARSLTSDNQESLQDDILQSVSEFGESLGSSLSLESTARSILENIERLVVSDFIELKTWDETTNKLVPYRLEGTGADIRAIQPAEKGIFGEYANHLTLTQKELFIADTRLSGAELFDPLNHNFPQIGSYIGIPLQAYGYFVGTLEIGVLPVNGFKIDDLRILQLIMRPAAVSLRNAELYESQLRWNNQLTSLTDLAKDAGSALDIQSLISRILAKLSPLLDVEVLGFLLYDQQHRSLQAQMPFQGLPDKIAEIYQTSVLPNSPIEKHFLNQEIISTPDASQDTTWAELGLQDVALAASLHDTNLIPLIATGRLLGFIQLSNHRNGATTLSKAELQLLQIASAQVAASLENVILLHQKHQHQKRDEALGLISSQINSQSALDDMLRDTLQATGDLLLADTSASGSIAQGIQNTESQIATLNQEIIWQKKLVAASQKSLPLLLQKDLEQTLALSQITQRARHIRASLQVTEAVSRQIDSNTALLMLGRQILTSFEMSVAIIVSETLDGPKITHVLGNLPGGINPETSFGQRNPLRTCLQTGEAIVSENLDEDKTWGDTPFLTNLEAKSFICIPVVINNRAIAAVLATDTQSMAAISTEDRQVYNQISKQVSIILQNISLLTETRQRLQEVNLLLDFSRHLTGLKPTEILKSLLESALKVVSPAHAGVVLVWEPLNNILVPVSAKNYVDDQGMLAITYHPGEGLPGQVSADGRPRRIDDVNVVSDYNLAPETLIKYRQATGGRWPVSAMIIPIQTREQQVGVLVLDNFNTPAAFHAEDEAILLSLTQQVTLSLENVRLMQTTQERASQLQALNAAAATLTTSLQQEELVGTLLERMGTIIPYDTAILWLRQENKMVVTDARGFDDNEERKGLKVEVADSVLLSEMTRTRQAIVVRDVRNDPRFTSLVQPRYLAWMGIPLITKDQVIGVLAIEKTEEQFYTDELMQLSTTFASQAAVAIDNAMLFEDSIRRAAELDERSQRLGMLNKFSAELGGSLGADQVLSLTANQLISALQVDRTLLLLLGKNNQNYLLNVLPDEAQHPSIYRRVPASVLLDHLRESQTVYAVEDIRHDLNMAPLLDFLADTSSLLILPLSGSENVYAIMLQSKRTRRFKAAEIELARTIGNQAAIALDNADLYQSTLATAERLSILNRVSFAIGSNLNEEDIYHAAHEATIKLMPAEAFVIALLEESTHEVAGVYVMDMGQRITGVRSPYGQGLSGQVIATGQSVLSLQASEAETQQGVAIGEKETAHSIVAVPMISGGKVIGALSAQSYQFNAYTEDDQQILSTLANQATVAILNARLLAETKKQANTLEQRVAERTTQLEHEQHNTETLLHILTDVTANLDLDRALNRTLALLNDAIGAEQGAIMLLHAEDNQLHYRAGYGSLSDAEEFDQSKPAIRIALSPGNGLLDWAVKYRKPVLVNDLRKDSRWSATPGSQSHRSALVVPLLVGEDVIGTIAVFHRSTGYFNQEALEMVNAIGSQVAIAINNAQLYELIRDQAERLGSMLRHQQIEASRQTAIFEAVADGVLVTDPSNQITFVNASVERILDISKAQMEGQSLENFAGLFGKTTQTWVQTIKDWAGKTGSTQSGETYAEKINLDNGRVVLVHLAAVMWHAEFLGTVSIFRDITHEVEVDRLKSEFVATVSHELRTPMTSIRGYVDLLTMGAAGDLSQSQSHFLDIVKSNIERLNVLVNDLLDVSRIEAGRVMLSLQPVDLENIANECLFDLQRRSVKDNKPMELSLDSDSSLPHVIADPERVHQILGNLLDNAYNYTPAKGQIKIFLHLVNGNVEVDVQDNGIGIALEHRNRIFERFFRGEDPQVLANPGTGLGLAIVKQLVEMHHGKIWMNSTGIPGQGSTFSFSLPAAKTEE